MDKPNYYAIIPAEVRYDKKLKDKAKLLYGEISTLCNKDGYCYATNRYFAELYGVSLTTISLLIKNLVDGGYLEHKIKYKGKTKEIEYRYLKILKYPYLKNLKGGIKENLKDNNTSINNKRKYKKKVIPEWFDKDLSSTETDNSGFNEFIKEFRDELVK